MKVLHVINSLAAGGAERLLADLLPRLERLGIHCEVLALDARGDVFSNSLSGAGVKVRWTQGNGCSPYSPTQLHAVMKAVREGMPDLVHSHLGPSFHWCSLASISCRDPVYVTTEHAVTNRRMAIPLLRGFERWCYRRNAALVCVSDSVAGSLAAWLGPDHPRIEVIPNGVETGHFDRILYPDPVLAQWKGERKLIVMTGRLVPEKDHATAIRALAALPPGFLIAFVGEGPLRPELEKASSKAGIGDRCRFLGTRVDLPAILATADIYLQSSRIEGFGIACLEAMSAGVPVVASEVGGLADLVRGAGALFPNGNARECARLIMELADNPALAAELSARGRERAATLSMSTVASRYSEMYQRAMKVDARERKTT